ncbi:uncharacterized protein LOC135937396 [Cloeon dipterum]|uniref:uncharacterized protein LOC135937396 n=1 Tax=Cloeon dipterum TaxID=197152 RepID=UPI00322099A0
MTFEENRKCNFRSLLSPKREVLLELLSDKDSLLRFFGSKDVPSVFVLYILSHGHRDGKIYTDHYESENSKEFVSFTTTDIFNSLKNLKLFDDCLKLINLGVNSMSSMDLTSSSCDASKVKVESEFFPWKSDSGANVRHRRAFLLFLEPNEAVDTIKKALSENLKFEISERMPGESSLELYCKEVSELEPDVGCVFTFLFGKLSEHEVTREVCCRFGDEDIAMTDILRNFIGPNNDKWIGKPKIFFLVDQEAATTDTLCSMKISWPKNFGVTSTNHSGWLVLVLHSKDTLQLLIEIFKGQELKKGKSLQELVENLLISESKEDRALLNSTLHFKLDFPDFPRSFLKLHFLVKGLSEFEREMVLSFDTIMEKALKGNRIWVLRSVAGAGKTTVLREIAFQLGALNSELKILRISLASISNKLMTKRGIGEIEFLAGATRYPINEVNKWILSKNCVVFLDGFDEINLKYQGKILTLIKSLKQRYTSVWIGTRPHEAKAIEEAVGNAVSAEIRPLNEEQQIEFLQLETNKSREQCQTFLDNFPSKDILQNPLHLSLVAQSGGKSNLYQVYKQVVRLKVEMCLKNRNGLDATHNQFEIEFDSAMELLEKIAFDSISYRPTSERKENLEKVNGYGVATFENDRLTFIHQTFAEFLAAQKIVYDIEENGELKSEEEQSLFHEYNLSQCWKFVDLYYCTILRSEKKIKVHREAFLEVARLNPDGFLQKVIQEGLRNIFSMLKPFMTYDETKDGRICYSRNLNSLESAVKSVDEIAAHLIEMDLFEGEDQVLESVPVLVETAAKYNAILFFHKLKERFPKLPLMIESKRSETSIIFAARYAAKRGHDKILDLLLENGVQAEANEGHYIMNESPLYDSCRGGFIKCVKILFKHGAREIRDGSPLIVSAEFGHLELVKFLLEEKLRERAELEEEWRAYKCALDNGHTDVAKCLLEMCPNLIGFKIQSAESPLHLAAVGEYWELCQWIVNEAGADVNTLIPSGDSKDWSKVENKYADFFLMLQNEVNKKYERGKTAIHCAAEYGISELVRKLINSGANVQEKDNSGWNSFHFACKNPRDNSNEVIQLLLSTDNQLVEKKTGSDQTGLHIFLQNRDRYKSKIDEAVYFLIEKAGVDTRVVDKEGRTALCIALDRNLSCVRYLLKEGIDLGFKNVKGQSHLHLAAELYDIKALQIWENLGGDLNFRDQTGSTAMHVAIEKGHFKFMEKLVELGADVNATNSNEETALHIASAKGCRHTVDCLLKKMADVNQRDDKGKTALHHAAANSVYRLDLVKNLLKHGASLTMTDNEGKNVLHHAIECKNEIVQPRHCTPPPMVNFKSSFHQQPHSPWSMTNFRDRSFGHTSAYEDYDEFENMLRTEVISNDDVIHWLVDQNCVDLNARNNLGETLLILALKKFRWKIVSFLLTKDVDVNIQDEKGKTALHHAANSFDLDSVRRLIENGADLKLTDKKGKNSLHHAYYGTIFDFIFEKNRDLAKAKLINGNTILHWAAKRDIVSNSLFSWLKEQNEVELNARNNLNETALLLACKRNKSNFAKQLLLVKGIEMNSIDLEGRTAVHYAAQSRDLDLMRKLFEKGADPSVTDIEGKNVLHHAIEVFATFMFIHELNGDLVKQRLENGDTILHLAIRSSWKNDVIDWLVEQRQVDLNCTNDSGETALLLACKYSKWELANLLLSKNVDIHAKDSVENTALYYAENSECFDGDVVRKLIDLGA